MPDLVPSRQRAWRREEVTDALETIGLIGIKWHPPPTYGSGEWICVCYRAPGT